MLSRRSSDDLAKTKQERLASTQVDAFDRKQRLQEDLKDGILKFNLKPKLGLASLHNKGQLDQNDPKAVALFIAECGPPRQDGGRGLPRQGGDVPGRVLRQGAALVRGADGLFGFVRCPGVVLRRRTPPTLSPRPVACPELVSHAGLEFDVAIRHFLWLPTPREKPRRSTASWRPLPRGIAR